jgi:PEP-CTERM motif
MFPPTLRLIVPFLSACLALPQAALADKSTDFSNLGGALSGSNASLSLTGSALDEVGTSSGTPVMGNLGTVSFSTGTLMSGPVQIGGALADGVLFSGAFSGPLTWTLTTLANGTHNYTLTTVVTGTMGSTPLQGVTVQLTVNTSKGLFNGSTSNTAGDTTAVSFVPEPSTLTMLSTGLLAIGGGIRRRLIV